MCIDVAYTFDDIKGTVTLLTALYTDLNSVELAAGHGKPAVSHEILNVLGVLREPLNNDDKRRFDLVVDKLIETRLNAQNSSKGSLEGGG